MEELVQKKSRRLLRLWNLLLKQMTLIEVLMRC